MKDLAFEVLSGTYGIAQFDPSESIPVWSQTASSGSFVSISRTPEELSIICQEALIPSDIDAVRGWHCLRIAGSSDPAAEVPGIVASAVGPLADAGISVFAVATYDTDYLLVPDLNAAKAALTAAGHHFDGGQQKL